MSARRDVVAEYIERQRLSDQPYIHADRILALIDRFDDDPNERVSDARRQLGALRNNVTQHLDSLESILAARAVSPEGEDT